MVDRADHTGGGRPTKIVPSPSMHRLKTVSSLRKRWFDRQKQSVLGNSRLFVFGIMVLTPIIRFEPPGRVASFPQPFDDFVYPAFAATLHLASAF